MIFAKTHFPIISSFVRTQGYLSFLIEFYSFPTWVLLPILVSGTILPLMPAQDVFDTSFSRYFMYLWNFKVEVSSRPANCKLIKVAHLMIPAQIFEAINAGLHMILG